MGSKRAASTSATDRFIAYNPKKTYKPEDRKLIKQLAGRLGSERRRIRQEKAARVQTVSPIDAGASSLPACDKSGTSWQSSPSTASSAISRTARGPSDDPLVSSDQVTMMSPTRLSQISSDYREYFPLASDIAHETPNDIMHPVSFAQSGPGDCNAIEFFGSCSQGNDLYESSFETLSDLSESAAWLQQHQFPDPIMDDTSVWPHIKPKELNTIASDGLVEAFPPPDSSSGHGHHAAVSVKQPLYPSPRSLADFGFSSTMSPSETGPQTLGLRDQLDQRQEWKPRSSEQTRWADVDGTLVDWIIDMERQGEAGTGSSSAFLDALSDVEATRFLWQLNHSRLHSGLVLCPGRPDEIHGGLEKRLGQISSGQHAHQEAIRLGFVQRIATSLVHKVSSLKRDIGIRRDLGLSSSADEVVAYRLEGLYPGTKSIKEQLCPNVGEE